VSSGKAAPTGRVQVLRVATYFLALLVVSTAVLLAYVSSVLAFGAFGVLIGVVLVLLVHQPITRVTAASAILLALAFVVPATLVHETFRSDHCIQGVPCDPVPDFNWELRRGLAAALLSAGLVMASIGSFRSSRHTHPQRQAPG
jgi:hypothetical protein